LARKQINNSSKKNEGDLKRGKGGGSGLDNTKTFRTLRISSMVIHNFNTLTLVVVGSKWRFKAAGA